MLILVLVIERGSTSSLWSEDLSLLLLLGPVVLLLELMKALGLLLGYVGSSLGTVLSLSVAMLDWLLLLVIGLPQLMLLADTTLGIDYAFVNVILIYEV
jgi:hypothetical protein